MVEGEVFRVAWGGKTGSAQALPAFLGLLLLDLLRFFHGLNHMGLGVLTSLFDRGEATVARITTDFLAARRSLLGHSDSPNLMSIT